MHKHPSVAVISFRDVCHGPWNVHGFSLSDLIASAFGATVHHVTPPTGHAYKVLANKGRRLDLVRRLPGRVGVVPPMTALDRHDLLFILAHGNVELNQLYASEHDWLDSPAIKVLVFVEAWASDVQGCPKDYARVLPHFDAVFFSRKELIPVLERATGVSIDFVPQAVDVLTTPYFDAPRLDVLTIGRRYPAQHELIRRWAEENDGWYHFDTLPANKVADVGLHRQVTVATLSRSAVSICNFARFDEPARIGPAKATGVRFFETLASGALIAGDLPTDLTFQEQFEGVEGVAQFPLECGHLTTDAVAELVALGSDVSIRRGNRAHALATQDLAHRVRQILRHLDIAEPSAITDRFAALEAQRRELLESRPLRRSLARA